MSSQAYIFELSKQSFPTSAVQNSHQLPVLVQFMGVWSGPCIVMADTLAKLATEFAGDFIFAKVDIDEQSELKDQYQIENVPTLIVLRNGEEVKREVGELQEDEMRALLREFGIFRASDDKREQARQLHMNGDTQNAVLLLTQAIKEDPSNTRVALDMVQIFIDLGQVEQAEGLLQRLPEKDRGSEIGQALAFQLKFSQLAAATDGADMLQQAIALQPDNLSARFDLAICLIAKHDMDQAVDQLMEILRQDAEFREGAAREMISLLSNAIANAQPDVAAQYRRQMANLLSDA